MRREKTIALLIDNLSGMGSYQEDIWQGVTRASRERGVALIIFPGGSLGFSPQNEFEYNRNIVYELIRADYIDGIVLSGGTIGNFISREEFQAFIKKFSPIPLVSISGGIPGVPTIMIDNESGLLKMFDHLIDTHGRRHIAFVRGPEENEDARKRYDVYRKVLAAHDLPFDEDLVFTGNFLELSGHEAVRYWLDRKKLAFDAVVGANDNMAIGALKELKARGVRVPADVVVAGFDDVFEASVILPGLSTVHQPVREQAYKAVEVLLDMLDGRRPENEMIFVDTDVVLRRSCGCSGFESDEPKAAAGTGGNRLLPVKAETCITELLRGLQIDPPETQELLKCLDGEVREGRRGVFTAVWEIFLQNNYTQPEQTAGYKELFFAIREKVLSEITDTDAAAAHDTLFRAHEVLSQAVCRIAATKRVEMENLMHQISSVGAALGSSFDIKRLSEIILEVMPTLQINDFIFALYRDQTNPLENLSIVCRADRGKPIEIPEEGLFVPAGALFSSDFIRKEVSSAHLVFPLFFKEDQLGLFVMELAAEYGVVYETIYSQLCSSVEGALLFEKNIAIRGEIEKHSRVIEDLSLPMVEEIGQISAITLERTQLVTGLIEQTKESRATITGTNETVERIASQSSKLVDIITVIEEIAERVNLLALNTAIEAAHVGKYGVGFAVIAKEIKQLSDTTRRHSIEIAQTLKEIIGFARDSARLGQRSVTSFQEQERGVDVILEAFRTISQKMEKLRENSQTILNVIKKN